MMTTHDYNWWPDGADERLVRQCNCETCMALIDRLEAVETTQPVTEAGDTDLTSYGVHA
jgi:hypothetical protein